MAKRLLPLSEAERIEAAHQICFQRPATESEQEAARNFREACRAGLPPPGEAAVWSAYLRTLLGSNEFLHLD